MSIAFLLRLASWLPLVLLGDDVSLWHFKGIFSWVASSHTSSRWAALCA